MAAPVSRWRLGLFVVLVVAAVIAAAVGFGECSTHHPTVAFYTYFDESVGGLGTGSRVAFRGVDVGSVSRISIAPDHRHIEVEYDLDAASLGKMGITAIEPKRRARYRVPADLRAEIGGNGITGVRNVTIDVVDPREAPPPVLKFPVPSNYIPATTSQLKGLEDALAKAASGIPAAVDAVLKASGRVDRMLAELERDKVSGKAAAALDHADRALGSLEVTMRRFDRERVPEKTARTLDDVRAAVAKVDGVLDQLEGEQGLVARMGRASDAVGQVGRGVASSTRDLDQALEGLRDAADAIRVLAEDLDREPDLLLKGRPKGGR